MTSAPDVAFSWVLPKLEVRETQTRGKGVFTNRSICAGDTLALLGGAIIAAVLEKGDHGIQVSESHVLASPPGAPLCVADFLNHSCDPNSGFRGQIALVAMRDIHADEEITFDYAMCLHSVYGVPRYELECSCGSLNCRHIIREDDWQDPALQQRYDGFFQQFLQDRIDRMKKGREQLSGRTLHSLSAAIPSTSEDQ